MANMAAPKMRLWTTPMYTVNSTVIMSMLMVIASPYAFSMREPLLK